MPMGKRPESDQFQEIDRHVGRCIRFARKERKISPKEVASLLKVSLTQLTKYETGENRISPGRLLILAEFLETPIWEFFPLQARPVSSEDLLTRLQQAFNSLPDAYAKSQVVELVQYMAYGPKQETRSQEKITLKS